MWAESKFWVERGLQGPEGSGMVTEQHCWAWGSELTDCWVPGFEGLGLKKRGLCFQCFYLLVHLFHYSVLFEI